MIIETFPVLKHGKSKPSLKQFLDTHCFQSRTSDSILGSVATKKRSNFHLCPCQGRLGAKMRGGSTPDFESDKIYSPTKHLVFWFESFFIYLSVYFSVYFCVCLPTCLPPSLPAIPLVFPFSFFSPPSPLLFLGDLQSDAIYSPTPGGSIRPP